MTMLITNVGILGLGKNAHNVARGVVLARDARLKAVGSNNLDEAQAFVSNYDGVRAYGSYIELLQDPDVDLIYITKTDEDQKSLIKLCLDYHKNVLCEYLFLNGVAEVEEMYAYAKEKNCFLMEDQTVSITPLNRKINRMIRTGIIGQIKVIDITYAVKLENKHEGVMKEVAIYPLTYTNLIANSSIKTIQVSSVERNDEGLDLSADIKVSYENDLIANIHLSTLEDIKNFAIINGKRGRIITENYWDAETSNIIIGSDIMPLSERKEDRYESIIEHASVCVLNGLAVSPVYGLNESLQVAKVIDAVKNY